MINNEIKRAQFKLEQHRSMGINSPLSVLEVAHLMDLIKKGETLSKSNQQSLFFSFSNN